LPDETGETLGQHTWDEEVLRETRGEFIFCHVGPPSFSIHDRLSSSYHLLTGYYPNQHSDLLQLLHETAVSLGAKIRMGVAVTGIDPETRRVKLTSGEILTGDVIVGADGATGVSRRLLELDDEEPVHRFNCYR
jgi:salicylate hydroxylase